MSGFSSSSVAFLFLSLCFLFFLWNILDKVDVRRTYHDRTVTSREYVSQQLVNIFDDITKQLIL